MPKSLLIAATILVFAGVATSSSYANPAINVTAAVAKKVLTVQGGKGDLGTQGGQNDPAQMFQQILQQLTEGQQRAPGGEGSNRVPLRPELKSRR